MKRVGVFLTLRRLSSKSERDDVPFVHAQICSGCSDLSLNESVSMQSERLNDLQQTFRRFAEVEARDLASPMYEELAYGVSNDDDLIDIARHTEMHQPAPNMLFAAVQYLLLTGVDHALSAHYPIISGSARSDSSAFADFRVFCLRHGDKVVELIRTRITQTNVVRRCTCLLPIFSMVSEESGSPLALVDVGASAGLNLNFDRYYYTYELKDQRKLNWGMSNSNVHLKAEMRGDALFPSLSREIAVASRDGIDLDPVDLTNPDELLWLRALMWPEHVERHQQLIDASIEFEQSDIHLHAGDPSDVLASLISTVPQEHALLVYSTIALYQFPESKRKRVAECLIQESQKRPVWQVALEGSDPRLSITRYRNRASHTEILAEASPHGWWMKWRQHGAR